MNSKQLLILALGGIGIVLIVLFTPKYKITWIDSQNYIKTEQTSPLYKRSRGTVQFHWEKILIYSGAATLVCGLLIFFTKEKNERDKYKQDNL